MEQSRYSCIAHGDLPVWNPVGASHLQRYVEQLALADDSTVLDIGCGRGHLLQLILSQYRARGIGVDSSRYAMAAAAQDLAVLVTAGRLTLVERTFDAGDYDAGSFDLVVCIGSTHAVGGFQETLQTAKRLLRPNSLLLVGEGYWRRTPSIDYFAFLKMAAEEQTTHEGNQSKGIKEGFDVLNCSECSLNEWDAYENQYARNVEDFVSANQQDPDAEAMLQHIRPWREAYLRWGRATLGFGLYLFRSRS